MNPLQTVLDALQAARDISPTVQYTAYYENAIAIVKQMMQEEPVGYEFRMRAESVVRWGIWSRCNKEQYEMYIRAPKLHDWVYETRALFAAPQAVPAWQTIESAPKDGTVILGYCVHTADPYFAREGLTNYGARCEGLGHVEDGIHAILWESASEESDGWESQSYWIPAGWVHNADCEQMANPTHWMPTPAAPQAVPVQEEPVAEVVQNTAHTYVEWKTGVHLSVGTKLYTAPQAVPSCPDCKAPDLLYECIHCSASNYPAAPKGAV